MDRLTLLSALKRVLIFSNQSSALIKLHLESNQLVVSGQDIDYSTSAEERVPCEYGDSPMNIGFKGTFLIEPKPMEPTKHQYDVDTETVIGFLRAHGLEKDFKVNIEVNHATLAGHTFEHELACAVDTGMLGSIDANRGDYQNGWDTDQFPIDNYELIQAMMQIIRNGGFGNGGTNFDAKTRRNSTDLEDIFIAHIAGMDAMARALENAAELLEKSPIKKMVADRYASFDAGKGKEFEEGKLSLEDVVAYAKTQGEPAQTSGKQELYEAIVNMYC